MVQNTFSVWLVVNPLPGAYSKSMLYSVCTVMVHLGYQHDWIWKQLTDSPLCGSVMTFPGKINEVRKSSPGLSPVLLWQARYKIQGENSVVCHHFLQASEFEPLLLLLVLWCLENLISLVLLQSLKTSSFLESTQVLSVKLELLRRPALWAKRLLTGSLVHSTGYH